MSRILFVFLIFSVAFSYSQNVGIGVSSPTKKLDVNGDELVGYITPRYTGPLSFTIPSTAFTATYVQSYVWTNNEHLYVLFTTSAIINWIQAQNLARFVKGHLLTPTSLEENNWIKSTILVHPSAQGNIPIGYTDINTEGKWQYITGEIGVIGNNTHFSDWYPPGPDNDGCGMGVDEDVAMYSSSAGDVQRRWGDIAPTSIGACTTEPLNAVIVEFEYTLCP